LQDVEQIIFDREQSFFNLLQIHFSSTDFRKVKATFEAATPFSFIVNKNVPSNMRISKRIRKFNWLGFNIKK
jgi:hypothetical protein